jgi:hypothetical protein
MVAATQAAEATKAIVRKKVKLKENWCPLIESRRLLGMRKTPLWRVGKQEGDLCG